LFPAARLFKDELTLANIARPQLVSMCQYMGLTPYGADAFLRFQLRTKLTAIKEDDRRILWEGVDELTMDEIREACQVRANTSGTGPELMPPWPCSRHSHFLPVFVCFPWTPRFLFGVVLQERGMAAVGLTDFEYKRQLQQWLELSIQKNIPISLLIMSR
jgi:LETM1 and EF-hand domain-containing protein 1